jgi:hypothetical protein
MLQFPLHSPLPAAARSPPYVLFGIHDVDCFFDLPPRIPLALVLHLAPKLRQYILPESKLSTATRLALHKPYVGINIFANLDIVGLAWIVARMLQVAGMPVDNEVFLTQPSIQSSISIHKAWMALELPLPGIQGLHAHLHAKLMLGDPVNLREIKALWSTFPTSSPLVLEMGLNFIRSHINFGYTHSEFSAIRHWYLAARERCDFFRSLENKFPEFAQVQKIVVAAVSQRVSAKSEGSAPKRVEKIEHVEKAKTKKKKPWMKENKMPESREPWTMRRHPVRSGSDESLGSVKTVVWDPPASNPVADPLSTALDGSALIEVLEEMAIEDRAQRELKMALTRQPTLRLKAHTTEEAECTSSEKERCRSSDTAVKLADTSRVVKRLKVKRRKTKAQEHDDEDKFYETVEHGEEFKKNFHPTAYEGAG